MSMLHRIDVFVLFTIELSYSLSLTHSQRLGLHQMAVAVNDFTRNHLCDAFKLDSIFEINCPSKKIHTNTHTYILNGNKWVQTSPIAHNTLNWIGATWVYFSFSEFCYCSHRLVEICRLKWNSHGSKWYAIMQLKVFFSGTMIAINIDYWEMVLFNIINLGFLAFDCITISTHCSHFSPSPG